MLSLKTFVFIYKLINDETHVFPYTHCFSVLCSSCTDGWKKIKIAKLFKLLEKSFQVQNVHVHPINIY